MKNPNQYGKDQENELGAKNEVAAKPETRALPSNSEEKESEKQGNQRLNLHHQTKMRKNQRS